VQVELRSSVQVELWTHSLKATGFKPLPLNINPGFKMCLSNSTCAATLWYGLALGVVGLALFTTRV
jgi:hypothetical protein